MCYFESKVLLKLLKKSWNCGFVFALILAPHCVLVFCLFVLSQATLAVVVHYISLDSPSGTERLMATLRLVWCGHRFPHSFYCTDCILTITLIDSDTVPKPEVLLKINFAKSM